MTLRAFIEKIFPQSVAVILIRIYHYLKSQFKNIYFYFIPYGNMRDIEDSIYDIIQNIEKHNIDTIKSIIFGIFSNKHLNTKKNFFLNSFINLISIQLFNPKEYKTCYDKSLKYYQQEQVNLFTSQEWQCLKQISIAVGMFKLAYLFFEKSLYSAKRRLIKRKIDKQLLHIAEFFYPGNQLTSFQSVFNYLRKKNICEFNSEFCTDFFNFVKGKSLVIMGPSFDPNNSDINLFDYDIVVLNNYKEKKQYSNFKQSAKKIISYYNGEIGAWFNRNFKTFDFKCLDFLIFKDCTSHLDISQFDIRDAPTIYSLFINSSPYMLPIMLFDLLQYEPKKIFILGNNLYLNNKPYADNYHNRMSAMTDLYAFRLAFAIHGIIDNFLWLQSLYKMKLFDTDLYFATILTNSIDSYLQQMEEIWVYPYL